MATSSSTVTRSRPGDPANSEEGEASIEDSVEQPRVSSPHRTTSRSTEAHFARQDGDGTSPGHQDVIHERRLATLKVYAAGSLYAAAVRLLHIAADAVVLVTLLCIAAFKAWHREFPMPAEETVSSVEHEHGLCASRTAEGVAVETPIRRLTDLPPSYDSVCSTPRREVDEASTADSTGNSSNRSTPRRTPISVSARRRVVILASPKSASPAALSTITPATANAVLDTPSFRSDAIQVQSMSHAVDDDHDELFHTMSAHLQSLIQQGTEALSSSVDHDPSSYNYTRRMDDKRRHARRQSLSDSPSLIPVRRRETHSLGDKDVQKHKIRHSMG